MRFDLATINWGDVPTWTGALLTGTSFLVAALAYRRSVRLAEKAQATEVTCWTADGYLIVKNGTDGAIYAVIAFFPKSSYRETLDLLSPYYNDDLFKVESWDCIAPNSEVKAQMRWPGFSGPAVPWLYFRDSAGVEWIRDYRGNLERRSYPVQEFLSADSYGRRISLRLRIRAIIALFREWIRQHSKSILSRKRSN